MGNGRSLTLPLFNQTVHDDVSTSSSESFPGQQQVVAIDRALVYNNDTGRWVFRFHQPPLVTPLHEDPLLSSSSTNPLLKTITPADKEASGLLSFDFDARCPLQITVYFDAERHCSETPEKQRYSSTYPTLVSCHPAGAKQHYSVNLPQDILTCNTFSWAFDPTSGKFPVVIELKPETNSDESYYTCASWDKHSQGPLTCLRQYVRYQNQEFQLHAIYGLQPVPRDPKSNSESSQLPNAARPSCIICLTNPPDTLLIPCRHLCLCVECVSVFTAKSHQCPICRQGVTQTLQLNIDEHPS